MRRLTLLLTMVISLVASGHPDTTETPKLLLGVTISPDICYRTLANDGSSSIATSIMNSRNEGESPKLSYSTGVSICFNLTNHWDVETGLQYSNKGFKRLISDLTFGDMIDPRYGFVYTQGSVPYEIILIDNFNYLDIPIRAIFSVGKGKVRFIASVGFTTNILISATSTTIRKYESEDKERSTQKQIHDYNTINISPTAGIGIDWQLSNKLNLRVEPTFRYGLLKIIDTQITAYLWSGGVNFTCYYDLK